MPSKLGGDATMHHHLYCVAFEAPLHEFVMHDPLFLKLAQWDDNVHAQHG